jgi:hypothetical protein
VRKNVYNNKKEKITQTKKQTKKNVRIEIRKEYFFISTKCWDIA